MAKSTLPADDVLLKEWSLVPGARVYEEDVLDFAHTILMRYGNYPETLDSSVATSVNEEATELVTLVSQTELSPRAQAVLAEIHAAPDNIRDNHRSSGAAAIRAAVDQVLPEEPLYGGDQRWMFERDARQECRKKFLAIVTELKKISSPSSMLLKTTMTDQKPPLWKVMYQADAWCTEVNDYRDSISPLICAIRDWLVPDEPEAPVDHSESWPMAYQNKSDAMWEQRQLLRILLTDEADRADKNK